MSVLEGVHHGPRPGRLRRIWCEVSGGHRIFVSDAYDRDGPFAVQVRCDRCGALSTWRNLRHRADRPARPTTPASEEAGT